MAIEEMKDWLGQVIRPGDRVIYAAISDRSANMVIAEIVSFNESGSVTVQPLKSSRWKQHSGRTRWVDSRTGKGIDPYKNEDHVKIPAKMRENATGIEHEYSQYEAMVRNGAAPVYKFTYVPAVFHDYVQQEHKPTARVTLTVTKNITKWTGEFDA